MKKRFVAFALLISAGVVSVSSGCVVREGYGHRYHHYRYHDHDHGGYGGGYGHYDHDGRY